MTGEHGDAMVEEGLYAALTARGMSRRTFLRFSTAMAAALALPAAYAPRIARAVERAPRLPVVWLRGQACGGNTEALLRAADPTASNLLLEVLAVDYHETLMTAAGNAAELGRTSVLERFPNGYLAVIEGSVPTGGAASSCLVGGRPFADVAREVADGALAVIALGSCAFDGGAPGANGGTTDAQGVRSVTGDARVIMLPGCPVNAANLAATIVHHVTFGDWPAVDMMGRPLAFYANLVHNQCERRPHFEFGEFALAWGDEGAQKGWCLYKVGCKGPETFGNCPTVRYGDGVSWNIRAGHGCVGCFMPNFWDGYGPAYRRLGSPVPFLPNLTVDTVGTLAVGGIAGVAAVHAAGMATRAKWRERTARQRAARPEEPREPRTVAAETGGDEHPTVLEVARVDAPADPAVAEPDAPAAPVPAGVGAGGTAEER